MKTKQIEIGSKIKFSTQKGFREGVVSGRNWFYDDLVSYIVRYDGMDVPVCANSFKSQLIG